MKVHRERRGTCDIERCEVVQSLWMDEGITQGLGTFGVEAIVWFMKIMVSPQSTGSVAVKEKDLQDSVIGSLGSQGG